MGKAEEEASRIRSAYKRREESGSSRLYLWHRDDVLFNQYRLRRETARVLVSHRFTNLCRLSALDVGCGTGGWLRTLAEWGASRANLHGIDLLEDRIELAKKLAPEIDFRVAYATELPFPDRSMDLVFAHTLFSSVLDPVIREQIAREMVRVLKQEGLILIYDFRISHPRNPDTVGIPKREIKRLFPDMQLSRRTLTLAPPLARLIAPLSCVLLHILELCVPFLRTHALYALQR